MGIFLNIFFYLPKSGILKLPEYLVYFTLLLFLIFVYIVKARKMKFSKELFLWIVFYISVNFIYVIFTGIGSVEFKYLIPVITLIVIFFSLSLLYEFDDYRLILTRKSIIVALIFATPILVYDFLFPGDFVTTIIADNRAVATYGNANIAGAVLILGMILTIDVIPKKYRVVFLFYIFLGVVVTFSRSNIMLYILILGMLTYQNKISKMLFLSFFIFLGLFLTFFLFEGNILLHNYLGVSLNDNNINRILFFVDNQNSDTSNMSERKIVLKAALEMFSSSPIFGNGFASTRLWEYSVGPHNSFARTWAEFGVIGLFIIPLFLLTSTYKVIRSGIKEYKSIGVLFIIYYSYSSMFSHNMLDQGFNYAGAIIIATLGYKNYNIERKNVKN